jgi:hypothetical protein
LKPSAAFLELGLSGIIRIPQAVTLIQREMLNATAFNRLSPKRLKQRSQKQLFARPAIPADIHKKDNSYFHNKTTNANWCRSEYVFWTGVDRSEKIDINNQTR